MDDEFTSGPWEGFYVYSWGHKDPMDLSLSFRDGRVSGSGSDPVGDFLIKGQFDREAKDVWWTKTYPGSHDVFYKGCRDRHGIWGTWELGLGARGGFHIWPRGQGGGVSAHAEADVDVPVDAVAPPPPPRRR